MRSPDLAPDEQAALAELEARLGRVHVRQRLGLEHDYESHIFRRGTHFFHIENWYSVHALIRWSLRLAGLHGRGRRNALDIRVREHEVTIANLPTAFDGYRLLQLSDLHVDLTPEFELDGEAMLAAIARHRPSIIYIAYPNNPTANLWDDAVIESIIEAAPGLVVIDEAYQPFSSRSYLDRVAKHQHVLLMRTLSKFGLAGVRIGYMMGNEALIAQVDKVRPPYNVSVLNCEAALFALEHEEVFAAPAAQLRQERARIQAALAGMGLRSWPSDANMILVRVPDAVRSFEGMKARKVLVKNISRMHPLLAGCLRLTVDTAEENTQLLAALQSTL